MTWFDSRSHLSSNHLTLWVLPCPLDRPRFASVLVTKNVTNWKNQQLMFTPRCIQNAFNDDLDMVDLGTWFGILSLLLKFMKEFVTNRQTKRFATALKCLRILDLNHQKRFFSANFFVCSASDCGWLYCETLVDKKIKISMSNKKKSVFVWRSRYDLTGPPLKRREERGVGKCSFSSKNSNSLTFTQSFISRYILTPP